jgi:phage tail sheath protein FI
MTGYSLSGGVDSAALGAAELTSGYALFSDSATSDISLVIGPDLPSGAETTVANDLIALVESRKDCVVFISPGAAHNTVTAMKTFFSGLTASSYAIFDSGRFITYDKYNDVSVTIPASGSVAALCARVDQTEGPWTSPAGVRKGQIRNVTRLLLNPTKAERDVLYQAGINPIVTFPGQGTILFGDKTGSGRPSTFDRINVRRLFITLEKSIGRTAQDLLFEFNDEFTRAQFVSIVEPLLRTIQGQRGIQDFRVVCDSTNNTADVIDRNELIGDIFIKPARSINVIQLNFIATRTSVEFSTAGA